MVYTPPSVTVTSIANNRIINISEDARLPAVVGPGPDVRTITDYPITRGSIVYDLLPTSGSAVKLTQVAAFPGASVADSRWTTYYETSGSTGSIHWNVNGTIGTNRPLLGETYYVSYTYPVPSTQFEPQVFTDSKDIQAFYGTEGTGIKVGETTGSGSLAIGANLALENGAPAVMCLQISGSYTASSVWTTAFNKLKKKDNISYLIPLASGSVGKTAAHSASILHVNQESAPAIGHEQEVILGASSGKTVEGIVTETTTLVSKKVIYCVPGKKVTRITAAGTTLTLDGAWVGAALGGLLTGQATNIRPVTGQVITGFTIPDQQYSPYIMNRLAGNGACVMASRSGIVKVRHAVTTDPTNAETREISVVAADDLVRRITRNKLTQRFVGKGIVIDDATVASVEATVASIWGALRRQRLIQNYGTKVDPTTGEVPISAVRDSAEPTQINVTGSIQFLYPLNYINVEFFVYV